MINSINQKINFSNIKDLTCVPVSCCFFKKKYFQYPSYTKKENKIPKNKDLKKKS